SSEPSGNEQSSRGGRGPAPATRKGPKSLNLLLLASPFVTGREPFQPRRDQCRCPAAIEEPISTTGRTMSLEKRLGLFSVLFMQRKKMLSAATLEGLLAVGSVRDKIFQGGEQKRTESALLPVDAYVDFVFNQVSEKALREILGIVQAVSAAAHETVKRRPIYLSKFRYCGCPNFRFRLASSGRENHAPVSRRKRITLATPVPCQRLHTSTSYPPHKKSKRTAKLRFCAARAPESVCKGK